MTQAKRIIEYINRFGSITPMDACMDLGITKLATRVSEMKKGGTIFEQKLEKGVNRWGRTNSFYEILVTKRRCK